MQKITPFLWFDDQAEEAAKFYTSIFKNSKITKVSHYSEEGPGEAGSVMVCGFELDGMEFLALNGGPHFKFTPAISMVVNCTTQEEVDYFWAKLSEGGSTNQCAWLMDKFGVSWQIVPTVLGELVGSPDKEKAARAMGAMLKMHKIDIAGLQRAYEGK